MRKDVDRSAKRLITLRYETAAHITDSAAGINILLRELSCELYRCVKALRWFAWQQSRQHFLYCPDEVDSRRTSTLNTFCGSKQRTVFRIFFNGQND